MRRHISRVLSRGLLVLPASVIAMVALIGIPMRGQTAAKPKPAVIVFWEDGFPAADTAQPVRGQLEALLPDAGFTPLAQLGDALSANDTRLRW